MLAGLWPLKACCIDGPFDVYQIAGLLPQTLHHLHVELDFYHRDYDKIDICIFQRFGSLRSLHLRAEQGQRANFQMQSSMALPNLRHLHLSPWPFKDNNMLANSLPQLTHAALHVHANEFEEYVKLPHINYLSLQRVNFGNPVRHQMNLRIIGHQMLCPCCCRQCKQCEVTCMHASTYSVFMLLAILLIYVQSGTCRLSGESFLWVDF